MLDHFSPSQPHQGWPSVPVDGLRWAFFACGDEEPTILVMPGVDPLCMRSAKMSRVEAALLVSDGPLTAAPLELSLWHAVSSRAASETAAPTGGHNQPQKPVTTES